MWGMGPWPISPCGEAVSHSLPDWIYLLQEGEGREPGTYVNFDCVACFVLELGKKFLHLKPAVVTQPLAICLVSSSQILYRSSGRRSIACRSSQI